MPTYTFKCTQCDRITETWLSIRDYSQNAPVFMCCGQEMGRHFNVAPGLASISDRHYEGLRASDGTDISSRAKHRAYMRERGLTTIDDYTGEWERARVARERLFAGDDPTRKHDIAEAITQLEARHA